MPGKSFLLIPLTVPPGAPGKIGAGVKTTLICITAARPGPPPSPLPDPTISSSKLNYRGLFLLPIQPSQVQMKTKGHRGDGSERRNRWAVGEGQAGDGV